MYSFQDLSAVATIYNATNIFPKSRWYFTFQQPDQPNIFSTHSNQFAAHLRKAYKSAFDALHTYEYAVDNCAEIMSQKISQLIDRGEADNLDIGWWMLCFAFDVNGEIAFAKRFGHMDEGKDIGNIAGALSERLDYCMHVGVYPSLHPWFWMVIGLLTAIMKQVDYTYVFTLQCIEEHQKRQKSPNDEEKAKPKDMLTRLFELHQEDPKAFTSNDVLIGAYSNIVAGADTTWITLGSILRNLHRNPDTLTKLRNEIETFANEGKICDPVTWEGAKKMPYLQACLREGMRMHSATGLPLWRVVPQGGAEICGKYFPEGVRIPLFRKHFR
jgi:cytochrome P450